MQHQKITEPNDIFLHDNFYFFFCQIADMNIFSWYHVIKQIKTLLPNNLTNFFVFLFSLSRFLPFLSVSCDSIVYKVTLVPQGTDTNVIYQSVLEKNTYWSYISHKT